MTTDTEAPTTTLDDIERASKAYAEQRTRLGELVSDFNDEMIMLKKDHLPGIKRALNRAAEKQLALQQLIESAPDLFLKPRTVIFHGVKVGYIKQKGSIKITDEDRTVALIRKYLPDQVETLIRTVDTPHKPALVQLSVADLKRVGCTVIETSDAVVIKAVDSEVDKMVDALLKDAVDTDSAAEQVAA